MDVAHALGEQGLGRDVDLEDFTRGIAHEQNRQPTQVAASAALTTGTGAFDVLRAGVAVGSLLARRTRLWRFTEVGPAVRQRRRSVRVIGAGVELAGHIREHVHDDDVSEVAGNTPHLLAVDDALERALLAQLDAAEAPTSTHLVCEPGLAADDGNF